MAWFFSRQHFTAQILAIAIGVSAILLAGAHISEHFFGLVPCALCLDQREAHWAAISVSIAGLVAGQIFKSHLGAAAAVGAVALIYFVSTGLAFYHTGVEFKFWPGPASCVAPTDFANIDLSVEALSAKTTHPSCDAVQWRLLGISMAGYNMLISAAMFAATMAATLWENRAAIRRLQTPNGAH